MRVQSLAAISTHALLTASLIALLLSSGCDSGSFVDEGGGGGAPTDNDPGVTDNDPGGTDNDPPGDVIVASTKWELWSADEVRLRGVDMHACALLDEEENACVTLIDRQDVQDVRDLGANLINASYPGLFNEQPPYEINTANRQDLDNLIEWADEVGMYVVINMRTGPGRNEAAIQVGLGWEPVTAVWTDRQAHDAWIDMWRYIAERYGDNPVVIGYVLMVEPHVNTWLDPDGALSPTEFEQQHRGTLGDWNAFAQEITDAIREVDNETPIVIDSLSWAGASWFPALMPTTDPLTVYSLHAYDPDVYISQGAGVTDITYPSVVVDEGESINFGADWLAENLQPAVDFATEHDVPIYVGEFGLFRWVPNGAQFISDELELFEGLGWNYAFYVWRGDVVGFDAFNMEYGSDPNSNASVAGNPLLGAFTNEWRRNVHFPENGQ